MSYSKIIKAPHIFITDEVKVIKHPVPIQSTELTRVAESESTENRVEEAEFLLARQELEQMMKDAEERAAEIIKMAEENAQSQLQAAEQQVAQWWTENEEKLKAQTEEQEALAQQRGYDEGYQRGNQDGYLHAQNEYTEKIEQARTVVEQAYEQKTAIVAEAEPFLLELSVAIAERVVKQELTSYPDKFIHLIQQHILRFKEREMITVCVHPTDFSFVLAQQMQLQAVVQGETEIKIIPDHSVAPQGCVIRTSFGSLDAQLDTQLEEIKKVILEARREPEDAVSG